MRNRLLATLRGLMAVVLMLFATNFLPVAAAYADTIEATAEANSADYWENAQTGTCVKDEGPFDEDATTYTLGAAPQNSTYTLLVVNGGTLNETYSNPVAGTAYSTSINPKNPNNKPFGLSHAIYCYKTSVQSIDLPAAPQVTDPCGTGNATWNVPANTTEITWTLNGDDELVATTNTGYQLSGGRTTYNYGVAPETNTDTCPQEEKFVYVCKYVGIPGVNERLKDGENPIRVAVSSIQHNQWDGTVPGYFSDAQDRSYVLAYDNGQTPPTIDDCKAPAPTEVTPAVVFTEPTCENAHGQVTVTAVNGVTYKVNGQAISGTSMYAAGSTVTVTVDLADGYVLTHDTDASFTHTFKAAPAGSDCVLGEVTPPAGQVLGATTLANTGENTIVNFIVGILALGLALGTAVMSRRSAKA
jgi:hypothetical protein